MTLQNNVGKIGAAIKRHSPEILTAVGVAGLAITTYLASRAGYKAGLVVMAETSKRMDSADDDAEVEILSAREIVKETWRFYIPVVLVGTLSCAAIIGSNRVSHNREVAFIGAAALAEQIHREYRDKVVEQTTRPKEEKIRDEVAQDKVKDKEDELEKLLLANPGDVLCIETHTGQTFVSTAEKIHRAENDANRECLSDGFVTLNTFLDYLGLPYTPAGEVVGWNNGRNKLEVRIGGAAHKGTQPVLTVKYVNEPTVTFMNPF